MVPSETVAVILIGLGVVSTGIGLLAFQLGYALGRLREIEEADDDREPYHPLPTAGHLYETPGPRWL